MRCIFVRIVWIIMGKLVANIANCLPLFDTVNKTQLFQSIELIKHRAIFKLLVQIAQDCRKQSTAHCILQLGVAQNKLIHILYLLIGKVRIVLSVSGQKVRMDNMAWNR